MGMETVFVKLLNMSLQASVVILVVMVLRRLLGKAPKWIHCLLWGLVALRLVLPFSIESSVSLAPRNDTVILETSVWGTDFIQNQEILSQGDQIFKPGQTAEIMVGKPKADAMNDASKPAEPKQISIAFWLSIVWVTGMVLMLAYAVWSYRRIARRVLTSIKIDDRIFICDEIETPFILGIVSHGIYLPSHIEETQLSSVIAHEKAHLRRGDHFWKPFGFALLVVYWFNPLCWIAYMLLCRDIELACDESVIRKMDAEQKKLYSRALLSFSEPRKLITICPLTFGEVGVKQRVKSILNYKKPTVWILVLAIVSMVGVGVFFLTDPKQDQGGDVTEKDSSTEQEEGPNREESNQGSLETQNPGTIGDDVIASNNASPVNNYICEKIGFGGLFTLSLYDNNRFIYYEGGYSSFIGDGTWEYDGETLILSEEGTGRLRQTYYTFEDGYLVYQQEGSDLFTYVQLEDGTRFLPENRMTQDRYDDLDRQLEQQSDEMRRRIEETNQKQNQKYDAVLSRKYDLGSTSGKICVDAREASYDEQMPISVWIELDGKVLWQGELGLPHMGWMQYYLYHDQDRDYVILYVPEESQGQIAYTFSMFTVDQEGNIEVKCEFEASSKEERGDFNKKTEAYLNQAELLVSTYTGEIQMGDFEK